MKIWRWVIWLIVIIVAAFVATILPPIWKYPFGFGIGTMCFLILDYDRKE
jgi:lauroyl/myristoyl acyltransferase